MLPLELEVADLHTVAAAETYRPVEAVDADNKMALNIVVVVSHFGL